MIRTKHIESYQTVTDAAGFNPGQEVINPTLNPGVGFEHLKFNQPIHVPVDGYIYVWVSNESEVTKVWFDDLTVTLTSTVVTQATDYGVWGDVLREQKAEESDYRYAYQGQFAEKDEETGWNHFELREYDPVIGRWLIPDPYRQYWSSYINIGNDPINFVDPDGGEGGPVQQVPNWLKDPVNQSQLLGASFLDEIIVTPIFDKSIIDHWLDFSKDFLDQYPLIGMKVYEQEDGWGNLNHELFGKRTFADPLDGTGYSVNHAGYIDGPQVATGIVEGGPARILRGTKTVLKALKLPTSGRIRFIPRKGWTPTQPLPRGVNGGYLDRFGNEWIKPKGIMQGNFHWDVQLGRNATPGFRYFSETGAHVNVTQFGKVGHQ